MTEKIEWTKIQESNEHPKMLEIYLEQAWQSAFCYALAVEPPEHDYQGAKLLMTIIAGNDSTMQAMKAAIDTGSGGLSFGYGIKGLTDYKFHKELRIFSEKGKYEKFPITINQNRKAIAIVHDELLGNNEYILSFDGEPSEDLRQVLGGGKYGLHILPEWKDVIYKEFITRQVLEKVELYCDSSLFPDGLYLYKLNLTEEDADNLISELITSKKLQFPKEGSGKSIEEITDLTSYMQAHINDMINKVSEEVTPIHNPLVDPIDYRIETYKRELFPVQAHVTTAVAKKLKKNKAVLIQGEMSTGKTTLMTAIADVLAGMGNKKGFHAALMCPPSLTKKWPEEIKEIIPQADVRVIEKTEQIIQYHAAWTKAGRKKPDKPIFFVISFTTMRGDSAIVPAVSFTYKKTSNQKLENMVPYRYGFYCSSCGKAHQVVESSRTETNESGEEIVIFEKRTMDEDEFGTSRRLHNAQKPANAFCSECGESLWAKSVPTRYSSFKEWAKHERELSHALKDGNERLAKHIQCSQDDIPKKQGSPRRLATIEYIRRKMNNFFDIALVDEIHELKSGASAQGNSLGSLAAVSKKVVGGTGTLFGGKAEDIYYTMFRLFPSLMVENGYKYSEVRKWNEEYGVIETTTYNQESETEYTNKQSRGGTKRTEKILPGISPFVFSKFLVQNSVLVRLVDVWPDPVELINVPTIMVDLDEDLHSHYRNMVNTFETAIDQREDGYKLYLPLTQTGIAYPDNPFSYPDFSIKTEEGDRELIWSPERFPEDRILNKEKKLQEIIKGEIEEGRKSIVYVRDTGSSVEGRDVRPRLKNILEHIGAKVCILDTSSTSTNKRSEWLKKKIDKEGYDVCIGATC
ncbi:helicase [Niallia taxi]|nr:helicase [Niallia taxi]MDE5055331.1 helicase [Niallia taxi]